MLVGSCHCGSCSWSYSEKPDFARTCNCSVCRRYGVLWAYGTEGNNVSVSGVTQTYVRAEAIEFHFCSTCACVVCWRLQNRENVDNPAIAVNLRLAEPQELSAIPLEEFDGQNTFKVLPRDGRCVLDVMFT